MQTATRPRPEDPAPCPPSALPAEAAPERPRGIEEPKGRRAGRRRPRSEGDPEPRRQRQLPLRTRIILGTAGGLLVVLGIAGLFLPFLQGILFLVLAAAVLSLTSRRIYHWLQKAIGDRWPQAWQRVERFRTRVRWKLRKK